MCPLYFFSSGGRHTRLTCDWSSDVCSSDLTAAAPSEICEKVPAVIVPAFSQDGPIAAGTSSQISDGAAAVVVTSAEFAERAGRSEERRAGKEGRQPSLTYT